MCNCKTTTPATNDDATQTLLRLLDPLIDQCEALDAFVIQQTEKLNRVLETRIDDGVTALHVETEREQLTDVIGVATVAVCSLQALFGTALKFLFKD